jgi:hypothetical protein
MIDLEALRIALNALPGAGKPHLLEDQPSQWLQGGTRCLLASGAWVEVAWYPEGGGLMGFANPQRSPWAHRLEGEPWDRYYRAGSPEAEEVRGMAPVSVLEIAYVPPEGGVERLVVAQDDALRWLAEEEGRVGEDFEDHRERNACWAALGLRRPRDGWSLETGGHDPDKPA